MDLEKRMRMAAESILEDEALREGLDDEAASILLDWGMARAKQIAAETANLEDESEAEEAVYPHMRALRRLLRAAAGLCAEGVQPAQQSELLREISDQVPLVYGPAVRFETGNCTVQPGKPAQIINDLRTSIENSVKDVPVLAPTIEDKGNKEVQKEQEPQKKRSFFGWFSDWFSKS